MSEELKNIVTPDDLMEEFVTDMVVADDELSDSILLVLIIILMTSASK